MDGRGLLNGLVDEELARRPEAVIVVVVLVLLEVASIVLLVKPLRLLQQQVQALHLVVNLLRRGLVLFIVIVVVIVQEVVVRHRLLVPLSLLELFEQCLLFLGEDLAVEQLVELAAAARRLNWVLLRVMLLDLFIDFIAHLLMLLLG